MEVVPTSSTTPKIDVKKISIKEVLENGYKLFLTFDPGFTNCGHFLGAYKTDSKTHQTTMLLFENFRKTSTICKETLRVEDISRDIRIFINGILPTWVENRLSFVAVEEQYVPFHKGAAIIVGCRLLLLEATLLNFFEYNKNIFSFRVNSKKVEAYLGQQVPDSPDKKSSARILIQSLCDFSVSHWDQHQIDSVAQACYVLQTLLKLKKPQIVLCHLVQ